MLPLLGHQASVLFNGSKRLAESKCVAVTIIPDVLGLCCQIGRREEALSVVKTQPHFNGETVVQDKSSYVQKVVCTVKPYTTSEDGDRLVTIT